MTDCRSKLCLKPTGQDVYLLLRRDKTGKNNFVGVTAFSREEDAIAAADYMKEKDADIENGILHSYIYELVEAIPISEV